MTCTSVSELYDRMLSLRAAYKSCVRHYKWNSIRHRKYFNILRPIPYLRARHLVSEGRKDLDENFIKGGWRGTPFLPSHVTTPRKKINRLYVHARPSFKPDENRSFWSGKTHYTVLLSCSVQVSGGRLPPFLLCLRRTNRGSSFMLLNVRVFMYDYNIVCFVINRGKQSKVKRHLLVRYFLTLYYFNDTFIDCRV